MGIVSLDSNKVTTFISVQGHWGHKKEKSLYHLNTFFLGERNGFNIFNPEKFVEFFKRLSFFCFGIIRLEGNIFFLNTHNYFKEIMLFFGLRSLQPVKLNNWVNGSLNNPSFKKPGALFISNVNNNMYILKEAYKKCIPVICVQDSDVSIDKISYSLLGNNDSKENFAQYSNVLSDSIIKAKLFNYCKKLI